MAELNDISEIKQRYEKLKYVAFAGKHVGYHGKWDLIEVASEDPFCELLQSVQEVAQEKVWKGFTNSQDSVVGLDWNYRLFVELSPNSSKSSTKFRITNISTFQYPLKMGFAMTVEAVVGAPN